MFGAAMLAALASLLTGQAIHSELPSFLYTSTPRYDAAAWTHGGDRFPSGAHLVLVTPEGHRSLVPTFFASADGNVSFDGHRILFAGRATKQDRWQIWEADVIGGTLRRVVTSIDSCVRPLYLPDGRVAYTRITLVGSEIGIISPKAGKEDVLTHVPGRYLTDDVLYDGRILFESRGELFTVYPDGTGVESLRCDHGPQRAGARQVSSRDVIFTVDGSLARYTSARAVQQSVAPTDLEVAGPVAEVTPDRWLVAARPRSGGAYAIYQAALPAGSLESVESPHGASAVEPVIVAERVRARDFPSARVPTRKTGNLLCLNVAESMTPIDGKIQSVRLYTRDAAGQSKVLGQTTVASGGSFYVEVPADRPIRMELLDAAGTRLRAEEHWFWMRPSEQRICVGCHAGPERAPENQVPAILNQTLKPVKMLADHGRTQ
jgi:Hydrazine synthase alpha subunit middle domain